MFLARQRNRRRTAGYTFLEVTVVVAILGSMSLLLSEALRSTRETDSFLEAGTRASEKGQQITYAITSLVSESRHLYENDDIGNEYLAACDLSRWPAAANARLPIIDPGADLHADSVGTPQAGNMLLFVREINASSCVCDKKKATERWIDTYRMIAIYPSMVSRTLVAGESQARDLIIWRSVGFPSYRQILEIGDSNQRKTVVMDLVDRYGCTHAWDPALGVGAAFFALSTDGSIASSPDVNVDLDEDEMLSDGGRLVYAGVRLADTSNESKLRRAVLTADPEAENAWTPDGLEVKISGASGSRKVWIHTVVEAVAKGGLRVAVQAHTTMAHVRDF